MDPTTQLRSDAQATLVKAGEDRFEGRRGLGINYIDFKVTSRESSDLFVVEVTMRARGGPVRHVHYKQDEWWYVVSGEFVVEIGQERFALKQGDSVWGPRAVPHAWACVGSPGDKLVALVAPAGKLEDFFLEVTRTDRLPGQDPDLWPRYDMEAVGPPLAID